MTTIVIPRFKEASRLDNGTIASLLRPGRNRGKTGAGRSKIGPDYLPKLPLELLHICHHYRSHLNRRMG